MAKYRPTLKKPIKTYIYAKPGTTIRPGATERSVMKIRDLATMRHIPPHGAKLELVTDVRRQLLKRDLVEIDKSEFDEAVAKIAKAEADARAEKKAGEAKAEKAAKKTKAEAKADAKKVAADAAEDQEARDRAAAEDKLADEARAASSS